MNRASIELPVFYREFADEVYASGEIPVQDQCNGFVAINRGLDVVKVNGVTLQPPAGAGLSGESYGVAGNFGEIYNKQTIKVVFLTTTGPNLLIVQKVYNSNTFPTR